MGNLIIFLRFPFPLPLVLAITPSIEVAHTAKLKKNRAMRRYAGNPMLLPLSLPLPYEEYVPDLSLPSLSLCFIHVANTPIQHPAADRPSVSDPIMQKNF